MPMASPASPGPTGYPFMPYPPEYFFAHNMGLLPTTPPPLTGLSSTLELPLFPQSSIGFPPQLANFALMQAAAAAAAPQTPMAMLPHGPGGPAPPSPVMSGNSNSQANSNSGRENQTGRHGPVHGHMEGSPEMKLMRHMLATITKMQESIKEVCKKQGEIVDSMSLLEQRVERIDETVTAVTETMKKVTEQVNAVEETMKRVNENVESTAEDSKSIRARVDDSESQDLFETRLKTLLDGALAKAVSSISLEVKDLRERCLETERFVRYDPFAWSPTGPPRFHHQPQPQYVNHRYHRGSVSHENHGSHGNHGSPVDAEKEQKEQREKKEEAAAAPPAPLGHVGVRKSV